MSTNGVDYSKKIMDLVNKSEALLNEIPNYELEKKLGPTKWSKKEILGHLIDSALNNIQRFVRSQFIRKPGIVYDQNQWVEKSVHQNANFNDLLQLWVGLNKHASFIIANMNDETLKKECNVGKDGIENLKNLDWLIKDYIYHMEYHLGQIGSSLRVLISLNNPYQK